MYYDAQDYGHDSVPEFMASWSRNDFGTDDQLRGMCVWYLAEKVARNIIEGEDEDEGDGDDE